MSPPTLLVRVSRRYNHVKMGDRWFWEILDSEGRTLDSRAVPLRHGVFTFDWARSEASAYRAASRRLRTVRRARAKSERPT